MWKRKRKAERLPWYRARNYKGNLTEAQKRQLDAFRMQPKHPAAQEEDLPEEVRDYIGQIEMELYDKKQEGAVAQAMFWSAIGAALLFLNYKGFFGAPTIWQYAVAVLCLVLPWFVYRYQWHKNAEEFLPSDEPRNVTDEALRQQWELNYIVSVRQAERRRAERNASESQAPGEWEEEEQWCRDRVEEAQTSGKSLGEILGEALELCAKAKQVGALSQSKVIRSRRSLLAGSPVAPGTLG